MGGSSSKAAADAAVAPGGKRKGDGHDAAVAKKAKGNDGVASPTKGGDAAAAAEAEDDGADAKGKGKGKGKAAAAAKGKGKAKAEAPFSWDDFVAHAHALDVAFGADSTTVRKAAVKKFSTGSYGWSYQGNEVLKGAAGDKAVAVRVGLNVTIANSKPKDAKAAAKEEDDDAEDGAAGAAGDAKAADGTNAEYKELLKAACPFDSFDAFKAAAAPLKVKFGAAGAPATAASVNPFDISAAVKKFSTGSFGWTYATNKKVEAHSDAAHGVQSVNVRIQLNITVANSKPAAAAAAGKKGKK